jgi:hypothetical protein
MWNEETWVGGSIPDILPQNCFAPTFVTQVPIDSGPVPKWKELESGGIKALSDQSLILQSLMEASSLGS